MNQSVPICSFEGDVSVCNQKKPSGPDHELMELLWRNGQVVLQSQTNRRSSFNPNESKQVQKPDHQAIKGDGSCGIPNNLIQDDEPVSWIHYSLEDSFEKEFCSNLFSDLPSSDPIEVDKTMRQFEEEKFVKFGSSNALHGFHNSSQQPKTKPPSTNVTCLEKQMPPPRLQYCNNNNSAPQNHNNLEELGKVVNFSQFTIPGKGILGCSSGQVIGKDESQGGEVRECSIMTVGSSHCGSNQILPESHMSKASSNVDGTNVGLSAGQLKEDRVQMTLSQSEGGKKEIVDPTFTSSSGGSGSSFGRTCQQSAGDNNTNNKRKNRDAEESECQSEAAELESAGTKKSCQRSGSSRKSRAAEVHNLSERRRRDRINERMRALQELIPHCNKTDKASLLDEAIEYLKSLQLQLQVMWMGSGMAPMMFPGMQHYMSRMGIGMGISPPAMPSIHNPMHMTGIPLVDPQTTNQTPVLCQTPVLNPINYQNQMQNTSFPEQYARFMGFHPMQTLPQPINMFSRLGCQTVQQNQSIPQQGISNGPFGGSTNSMNGGLSGKIEFGGYYYPFLSKFESYPYVKANM